MRHRAGCRFHLGWAVACAALAGYAHAARAQSDHAQPRLNAVVVHEGKTVPADGGLLVLVPASHPGPDAKAAQASVEVLHDGEPVAGALREIGWVENLTALSMSTNALIGAGLVWTADEPLAPDERYDVHVHAAGGEPFGSSFTAGEGWEPARPELDFDAELGSADTGQQEEHCCSRFLDGTGNGGCFVKRYAEIPALVPELAPGDTEEHLQQFLYLFRAFDPDTGATLWESGFRTYDSTDVPVLFLASQAQYCVDLEAMHIVSGETFHWSRCVSADELPESVIDPAGAIAEALQLEHCSVPEYGDVLQWCEINRQECSASKDPECALYVPLCKGTLREALDVLLEMDAIREGRSDAGVDHDHDHDHDAGPASDEDERDSGCRAAGAGASPGGNTGHLLVALALLALRRRSRVRREFR